MVLVLSSHGYLVSLFSIMETPTNSFQHPIRRYWYIWTFDRPTFRLQQIQDHPLQHSLRSREHNRNSLRWLARNPHQEQRYCDCDFVLTMYCWSFDPPRTASLTSQQGNFTVRTLLHLLLGRYHTTDLHMAHPKHCRRHQAQDYHCPGIYRHVPWEYHRATFIFDGREAVL
jgi:hypothetical protein